ncbi:MAG: hypothetical protein C0459_01330 [Chitinophaga sp.]|jgi:hypothetical protein|nr:hypothetical protein [Chitinophaga sp.]
MALDITTLLNAMITAAQGSLSASIPSLTQPAQAAFKALAQNLVDIEQMKLDGTCTQEQAELLINMQKQAVQTVLLTEKGLALLAVQNAINAALGAIATTVNTAIGWALL